MTPTGTPSPDKNDHESCRECEQYDLAEAVAKAEGDASRETDCRVLRKRHQQAEHGGQQR